MTITIFHNPDCGTSRNTLALIRATGTEPDVIEYLRTPPSGPDLLALAARIGLPLRDLLRRRGTPFHVLGLDDPAKTDAVLLKAVAAHPILLNRPIVSTYQGAQLCRPSDLVFDVMDPPSERLLKEDGIPVLRDEPLTRHERPELAAALNEAGLPADDIAELGRKFYRYRTLDGEVIGYGGLEPYGANALLRSITVLPAWRGKGLGESLTAILARRAFNLGARDLYLLTNTAQGFFKKLSFNVVDRTTAPEAIRASRQFAGLCSASTPLMSRRADP